MVDPVPIERRPSSNARHGNMSRTRSLISRFLMCANLPARAASPESVTNATATQVVGSNTPSQQAAPSFRRNPHRRSSGQLATGQAIRKTFPISALSLLVNVKKDRVHWHGDHLHLIVDTVTKAKLSLNNMKKGTTILEVSVEEGLNQTIVIPVSKPGLYSLKITAETPNLFEASMVKMQRTELELHKGNDVLVPRVIGQYVQVEGGVQYSLLEIYGRPMSSSSDTIGIADDLDAERAILGDDGKECVVCLSSDRDTIVLPCRHLCLCAECAENLRSRVDKCPICRECCQGLLQVKLIEENTK